MISPRLDLLRSARRRAARGTLARTDGKAGDVRKFQQSMQNQSRGGVGLGWNTSPGRSISARIKIQWIQRQRVAALFANHGVEVERLELLGHSSHAELFRTYHRVDIGLDTFPYSGGLTTCEALWMGVPVITLPGETFASRHSLSHLSNVGLSEMVCEGPSDYVQKVVDLAGDLPRLAAMRASLRDRVAASPLCDGNRFTKSFQIACRRIWCHWCGRQSH